MVDGIGHRSSRFKYGYLVKPFGSWRWKEHFFFWGGGDDFDPYTHVGTWRRYFRRLPGKMSWHILMLSTCKVHESFKTTSVGFISTSQQSLECPGQLVGLTAWLPSPQDFHVRSSEKKLWRMSRMSTVHRFCLDLMILWLVCGLVFFPYIGNVMSSQLTFTPSFFRGVGLNHQPVVLFIRSGINHY